MPSPQMTHMRAELHVWCFHLGNRGKEKGGDTTVCREDTLGFIYYTFSQFLLRQLICMCLPRSSAVTLRELPPLHLLILIALYLLLSASFPQLSFFATVVTQLPVPSCSDKQLAAARTENQISLQNWWVRQMWCVCVYVCVWISHLSMTHTGLAHLSWSTHTLAASQNTAAGSSWRRRGGEI